MWRINMENLLKNNYEMIVKAAKRIIIEMLSQGKPYNEIVITIAQFNLDESFVQSICNKKTGIIVDNTGRLSWLQGKLNSVCSFFLI